MCNWTSVRFCIRHKPELEKDWPYISSAERGLGMLGDSRPTSVSRRGNPILSCIRHSTAEQPTEGIAQCDVLAQNLGRMWKLLDALRGWNRAGGRAIRPVHWKAAEETEFVQFGEKETEGRPHCSAQFLKEEQWRVRCSLLPRIQWQSLEWLKAALGEFKIWH